MCEINNKKDRSGANLETRKQRYTTDVTFLTVPTIYAI